MSGRSAWIPWAFVGGFGVVLAANAAMVFFAFESWTGVDRANAYEAGLAYDETLEQRAAQAALGWTVDVDVAPAGNGRARVTVAMADDEGVPVDRASVRARFHRPTHGGADFETALGWLGDGRYGTEVNLPLPGLWEVHVVAAARGSHWREATRVDLR